MVIDVVTVVHQTQTIPVVSQSMMTFIILDLWSVFFFFISSLLQNVALPENVRLRMAITDMQSCVFKIATEILLWQRNEQMHHFKKPLLAFECVELCMVIF
jgi:hypothetical protein